VIERSATPSEVSKEAFRAFVESSKVGVTLAEIGRVNAFDTFVPVGFTLSTVTATFPVEATSGASILASKRVEESTSVGFGVPFHSRTEVESKFEPVAISLNATPPAMTAPGPMLFSTGAAPGAPLTTYWTVTVVGLP